MVASADDLEKDMGLRTDDADNDETWDSSDSESDSDSETLSTEEFCVFCGKTLPCQYTMSKHLKYCIKINYTSKYVNK